MTKSVIGLRTPRFVLLLVVFSIFPCLNLVNWYYSYYIANGDGKCFVAHAFWYSHELFAFSRQITRNANMLLHVLDRDFGFAVVAGPVLYKYLDAFGVSGTYLKWRFGA